MRGVAGDGGVDGSRTAEGWFVVPVVVRRAEEGDAAELAELAAAAFRATYAGLLDEATVEAVVAQTCTAGAFARLATSTEPDLLLVADEDGVLQGFLEFVREPDGLELRRLYARTGATSRGVGAALLAALEESLPGGTTYRIVVVEQNVRGLAFWQRHGFRLQGEVDGVAHFAAHRDVRFEPGAASARLLVLDRTVPAPGS